MVDIIDTNENSGSPSFRGVTTETSMNEMYNNTIDAGGKGKINSHLYFQMRLILMNL